MDSYFDDTSMLRRVHREFAVALSGPRALLMQAAHPVAFEGFFAHSGALDEPYERLRRTADVMNTIGFGARWLMTEIERRGVGEDRVLFASDEPWSDFWSEYWKINGAPVSDELKRRILHQNYEELYGEKA